VSARPHLSRDPRIDMLRGFALLTIFIDHVPGNPMTLVTLRNFGFADAAELFVILSGVSSMAAYGRGFERDGARAGLRRVALRCVRLYLFQVLLLLGTLATVDLWRTHFGLQPHGLAPFFEHPFIGLAHGLLLQAQPGSLNILPLYIVLMATFPLIYAGVRYLPAVAIPVSVLLWLVANLDHDFNLTNWLDGQGWFFNPFAWQLLFTLGVLGAMALRANGGELPRRRWLRVAAWAYLIGAAVLAAPWAGLGITDMRLFALAASDKTNLAPERLLDILAITYLALSSPALRRVADMTWANLLVACGRHSLEVFSFGTLLGLFGRLLLRTSGESWQLALTINLFGIACMIALALLLERQRLAVAGARRQRETIANVDVPRARAANLL
jgi:hypothetical protein